MKTKSRGLSKTELPVVRHRLGMTIKDMAGAVGLKLPSYYYYETRYVGEELPAWLADKIVALARKKNVDLSARMLRAPAELRIRNGGHDQARLLRDILRTLHDIRVIMRERRGPSAVFVVKDERRFQGLRGTANGAMRAR
jgi:DNA-binding XRE family transcriptional regulator